MPDLPMLLTVQQAAHELGISRSQVYNYLAQGHLSRVKLGKSMRIPRSELETFISTRLHPDTAPPAA